MATGWRVFLATCVLLGARLATAAPVDERAVKALLVINFAKFVEWPEAPEASEAPLVIGVLEPDTLGATLDRLAAATTVRGRPVVVRRFGRPQDVSDVHVLYAGRGSNDATSLALERSRKGVLTVGEGDDFIERGGIVRLFTVKDRVRFEISPEAAILAGLDVDSHLLQLGTPATATRGRR